MLHSGAPPPEEARAGAKHRTRTPQSLRARAATAWRLSPHGASQALASGMGSARQLAMRFLLGLGLALHGVIHLLGFVVPWRLAEFRGFPYSTSALWGRVDLGDAGAKVLGLAWLLGGLDFFVAAMGIWLAAPWALWMVMVAAALSICLCLAGAPASAPGLFVDGLIFAAVLTARGTGLWAPPTP